MKNRLVLKNFKKRRVKKYNHYILMAVLLLAIFLTIGYAYLQTSISLNGTTKIAKNTWDVRFANLLLDKGNVTATTPATLKNNDTLMDFTLTLKNPGDYYNFVVDVINSGTIDAKISSVTMSGLTTTQKKYIDFVATYSDGEEIKAGDGLLAGSSDKLKISLKYRTDIDSSNYPHSNETLKLTFKVNYVQAT